MDQHRQAEPPKRRLRFSIRTLLIMMTVLGPLGGWYDPVAVERVRDYFEPARDVNRAKNERARLR